jgi:hypothetical protein
MSQCCPVGSKPEKDVCRCEVKLEKCVDNLQGLSHEGLQLWRVGLKLRRMSYDYGVPSLQNPAFQRAG